MTSVSPPATRPVLCPRTVSGCEFIFQTHWELGAHLPLPGPVPAALWHEAWMSARVLSMREEAGSVQTQAVVASSHPARARLEKPPQGQLPMESPSLHRQSRPEKGGQAVQLSMESRERSPPVLWVCSWVSGQTLAGANLSLWGRPAGAHTQRLPEGLRFDQRKSPRFQCCCQGVARRGVATAGTPELPLSLLGSRQDTPGGWFGATGPFRGSVPFIPHWLRHES